MWIGVRLDLRAQFGCPLDVYMPQDAVHVEHEANALACFISTCPPATREHRRAPPRDAIHKDREELMLTVGIVEATSATIVLDTV